MSRTVAAPPLRRATTWPVFWATYSVGSPLRTAMANGCWRVATWVARTCTAARFGPPDAGGPGGVVTRGVEGLRGAALELGPGAPVVGATPVAVVLVGATVVDGDAGAEEVVVPAARSRP